jgi:hypothetical protein
LRAFAAEAEAQRQQVGDAVEAGLAPIEQPQRFLVDRPQALQPLLLGRRELAFQAALHQGDLHLGGVGQQLLQVVARAGGGHQVQLEAFLGQFLLEPFGELLVGAALCAAC